MLTEEDLRGMEPDTVFAKGEGLIPRLYSEPVMWVAKRGLIHDWTIYYHRAEMSYEFVESNGDKVITKEVIKMLVPCDARAYKMYRL